MSLARMSRANTLLPHTLDSESLRMRALPLLPSHCSDGTVTLFSIRAANAWELSGVSVTLTPAINPPCRKERRDISRLDMDHPLDGYEIRPCHYGVLGNLRSYRNPPDDAKG
ncbi:hypothetical protein D3C71_1792630 [compost metagenome]